MVEIGATNHIAAAAILTRKHDVIIGEVRIGPCAHENGTWKEEEEEQEEKEEEEDEERKRKRKREKDRRGREREGEQERKK